MIREMVFGLAGGLGLFLFGMKLMSEGLRAAAGQKLKSILESMTKKAVVAFLSDLAEIERLRREVQEMFDRVIASLQESDSRAAESVLTNEKNLNRMQIESRRRHVNRMRDGACYAEGGLIFVDLVNSIEKIGDRPTSIAPAVVGGLQWVGV